MKKILHFLTISLFFSSSILLGQDLQKINGRITDGEKPLEAVTVLIEDSDQGTTSNSNGFYQLQVRPGDVIKYQYLGFKETFYVVEDHSRVVNITLIPEAEQLDEVVVAGRKSRQKVYLEEYATNKNLIHTGFGILNKETSTFALRVVDGDDLFLGGDILSAIQARIPGIRIGRPLTQFANPINQGFGRDPTAPVVFLPRRFNSLRNPRPAVFEVDGVVYTDPPMFLNPQLVDRVAVINSAIGTTRYGQIAAGGVIVINTTYGPFSSDRVNYRAQQEARLNNNVFDEFEVSNTTAAPKNKYVELLYNAADKKEAEALLKENKMLEMSSAYVNLEIGDYFLEQWNDKEQFKEIYLGVAETNKYNATVLKAIAYRFQQTNLVDEAWELYKEIFLLRPSYGQSYVDLAHAAADLGDREKAAELLARYIRYKDLDLKSGTQGIDSIIKSDFRYYLDDNQEDLTDIPEEELLGSTRLYFEWNNGDAEFQLQFVNPEKRFYEWDHTYDGNYEQIVKEKKEGFSSAQFVIDENLPGNWMVNLRYHGNKSFDPTFVKSTVYYHYGTPFEEKRTYWHRLTEKNVLLNLFSLVHNPVFRQTAP